MGNRQREPKVRVLTQEVDTEKGFEPLGRPNTVPNQSGRMPSRRN